MGEIRKQLIIQRSCIPDRWKDKQNQIYRKIQLGWVSNWFLYNLDITDFQFQYGGTVL